MRHEYSHEQDGGEISQAAPIPSPSLPSDGVDRPIADATITIQDGTGATTIVNPGCVSSTTMALWLLGVLAVFEIVENMMADDLFLAFVSTLKTLLLFVVAFGLSRRYRWAASLMLIVSLMLAGEFLIPPSMVMVEGANRYLSVIEARVLLLGISGAMFALLGTLFIAAGIWFWRKRDGFVPHPGVEASGYRLHLLALVIAGVVIVAAVVNTIDEMDSLLESQARDFRELDRVSREMQ